MALKGKKKSHSRGSQGRRRPASAPRPIAAPRPPGRWYRTPAGRAVAAIVVLSLVGGIIAAVVNVRSGAGDLERRQDALVDFTGEVRAALQVLRGATGAMSEAPVTAGSEPLGPLRKAAEGWARTIQNGQSDLVGIAPPRDPETARGTETALRLYVQSTQLYVTAAKTYSLVADVGTEARDGLLQRAAEQRDQAAQIWQTGTQLLDAERGDAELGLSALASPSIPGTVGPQPTPGDGQGQGGQGDGQGQGGQGDGGN